jgi:hypothetical protein
MRTAPTATPPGKQRRPNEVIRLLEERFEGLRGRQRQWPARTPLADGVYFTNHGIEELRSAQARRKSPLSGCLRYAAS